MEWLKSFWSNHGERLTFIFLANALGGLLLSLKLITGDEAKVVFIGSMMLFYNKARSPNGTTKPTPTIEPNEEVPNAPQT